MSTSPAETDDLGSELTRLASADNFRDVAGDGYPTTDGRRLRTGVLFRSNELQLTDADAHALGSLGITAVYDLRETHEVDAHPDIEVPGSTWHHVEVRGIPMDSVSHLASRDEGLAAMRGVYRAFVDNPDARASFAELLTRLATTDGAQLFHCTAGKDRTGWAAALVLTLCGVDRDVVVTDYLLTNAVGGTREKYLAMVREHLGEDKVAVYETVMVADAAYLQEAFDAVAATYGSIEDYVRDGLGVSDETVAALVSRELA